MYLSETFYGMTLVSEILLNMLMFAYANDSVLVFKHGQMKRFCMGMSRINNFKII